MAAYAQPAQRLPVNATELFQFLKAELAPQPGMYATLARVMVTIVIVFLIAATFRLPYAAITLYSVFTVDRSSRRAALVRSLESIIAVTLGVALALAGVLFFVQLPLLTFAYYGLELFVVAFLIRTTRLQGPAMNMGMAVYSVHNIWESPFPAGPHIEQTLWVWLTLCLGFAVSVAVEYAFVREDPFQQIRARLMGRLRALSSFFSALAGPAHSDLPERRVVSSYAGAGTGDIRNRIATLRTTDPAIRQQLLALNTVTALIARLIDMAATIDPGARPSEDDQRRLLELAAELDRIQAILMSGTVLSAGEYQPSAGPSASIPSLPELERTAAMIPAAFSATQSHSDDPAVQLVPAKEKVQIFIPDAFTNFAYVQFALNTMFAALICYILYSGFAWPGISTSVVTCLVTALNTGGATRQKQLLRLTGATFGGLVALGSMVFLLPEVTSITGVTILVTAVSAFSAWFALSSQRVAYFGLQTALAFYLALIQDYTATTELAPARDRALGVLLGLAVMWLVFDNLWPVSAIVEMQRGFARNIRLLAQLITALDQPDRGVAIRTIRDLRDRIQAGFTTVNGHADSVLFEFGSRDRQRKLQLRESILRLQAMLRTLFVVEIAICQYRTQVVPGTRPPVVRETQQAFDKTFANTLLYIADAVDELRPANTDPQLQEALQRLESVLASWDQTLRDQWVKTRLAGVLALLRQAVSLADQLGQSCAWC